MTLILRGLAFVVCQQILHVNSKSVRIFYGSFRVVAFVWGVERMPSLADEVATKLQKWIGSGVFRA